VGHSLTKTFLAGQNSAISVHVSIRKLIYIVFVGHSKSSVVGQKWPEVLALAATGLDHFQAAINK